MSLSSRINEKICGFQYLQNSLKVLEVDGHLDVLHNVFGNIYRSKENRKEEFKESLKIIVNNLIDILWKESPRNEDEMYQTPSPKINEISKSRSTTAFNTERSTYRQVYSAKSPASCRKSPLDHFDIVVPSESRTPKLLQQRNSSPLANQNNSFQLISDFGYQPGAVTFCKADRKLNEVKTLTPGPGAYETKQLNRSPSALMPRAIRRADNKTPTPSPGDYNPLVRFLSKRL
ncbi:unnamed protein product [Blepharisma stoltei]|uniref:Uncharacterized protein n=1 Tax=Blepharisma stoltei TaxID=1481888 RepID=A0AAU9IYG7_9CILI|nr:unnamed protein product [Blepharisma stoltei]